MTFVAVRVVGGEKAFRNVLAAELGALGNHHVAKLVLDALTGFAFDLVHHLVDHPVAQGVEVAAIPLH